MVMSIEDRYQGPRELIPGKRQEKLETTSSGIWLVRGYKRRADGNDITTHAKKVATVRFLSAVKVGFLFYPLASYEQ